ncbi:anti-sigma F factor antagonist [Alkaliphilus peptidifermentans]|uniref:Anti-sigma F factor antagonist n=1 Tax=Alkaliphilus peptidifermentans DSM 18978 TaxID=1120976 RepID=A0A1G5JWL6_9FIRM|nr:anti-sigma F factor antagonist [Alkaliphilus peptidifermentans]SCY92311.1 anti-anti-sigma regulatory factor, SpoIIAA [Alkaliphilus peptidifermentans DSM 18978]
MLFNYEAFDNKLIVKLEGELDHHVSEEIRQELDDLIEKKRSRHLVFDLSGLEFMDSSGIGVIMGRYKNVSKMGGKVAVIKVSDKIDKIFSLSGLYRIVGKYENLQEAFDCM